MDRVGRESTGATIPHNGDAVQIATRWCPYSVNRVPLKLEGWIVDPHGPPRPIGTRRSRWSAAAESSAPARSAATIFSRPRRTARCVDWKRSRRCSSAPNHGPDEIVASMGPNPMDPAGPRALLWRRQSLVVLSVSRRTGFPILGGVCAKSTADADGMLDVGRKRARWRCAVDVAGRGAAAASSYRCPAAIRRLRVAIPQSSRSAPICPLRLVGSLSVDCTDSTVAARGRGARSDAEACEVKDRQTYEEHSEQSRRHHSRRGDRRSEGRLHQLPQCEGEDQHRPDHEHHRGQQHSPAAGTEQTPPPPAGTPA